MCKKKVTAHHLTHFLKRKLMKRKIQINPKSFTAPLCVLMFILLVFASSCARKANFTTSTIVPASEGKVKVKKDNNKNYVVDIDVKNLADPNRLPVPKSTYVAWIETQSNGVQNIGQLKTSTGLLSSTLKASLETSTPFKPVRVFITAEDNASIQYPGNYVVLNTASF